MSCRKNLPYLPAAAQPIGFEVIKGWKMQVVSTGFKGIYQDLTWCCGGRIPPLRMFYTQQCQTKTGLLGWCSGDHCTPCQDAVASYGHKKGLQSRLTLKT